MGGRRWGAFGAGLLVAGTLAAVTGVIETIASGGTHPPGAVDLLYGADLRLLLVLALTLILRIAFWRTGDAGFVWIPAGGWLAVELGAIVPFWLDEGHHMPSFASALGKIITLAAFIMGAFIAVLLVRTVARSRFGSRLSRWSRGAPGRIGIAAALAVAALNGFLVWRALPRSPAVTMHAEAAREAHPDVFVILIDTLRRDHLGWDGYRRPTSPNLDGLCAESYNFLAAYTPSNWTIPSVASFFTGLYPSAHGVYGDRARLPEKAWTLAEQFRGYGYQTGAFVANPLICREQGFAQGFARFFPAGRPWWSRSMRTVFERTAARSSLGGELNTWRLGFGEDVVREFLGWLDAERGHPRFGYVHLIDPHHPYHPPTAHRDAVAPGVPPGPRVTPDFLEHRTDPDCGDWECVSNPPVLAPVELEGMVANYDGEIHYADALVGRMVAGLRERGLLERCHLVVLSDHGEEFFDHRGWRHTYSIYEEVSGGILVYRPPGGVAGGRAIRRPVASLDLLRTLCERIGLEAQPSHQGHPIPELLDGTQSRVDLPVLCELPPYLYSLRLRDWKLIRRGPLHSPDWRLYDLGRDPQEAVNLANAEPDTLALLRGTLEGILASLQPAGLGEREEVNDPETLERLRALGYIR